VWAWGTYQQLHLMIWGNAKYQKRMFVEGSKPTVVSLLVYGEKYHPIFHDP
jgi:hypothetical protein